MWVLRVISGAVALFLPLCPAATLEKMSLPELIRESTAIVRGRALDQRTVRQGPLIYTLARFEVLEQWKGPQAPQVEIALPGGTMGNLSQRFGGVPQLESGREFVVFLWTGPSGRTQITGLSQGLFEVLRAPDGQVRVIRQPSADLMLAPGSGTPVRNSALDLPLVDLAAQIQSSETRGSPSQP